MATGKFETWLFRLAVRPGLFLLASTFIGAEATHFEAAQKLYRSAQYAAALEELKLSAETKEPATARDLYAAMCEEQLGRWKEAEAELTPYVAANPSDSAGWYWLGNARLLQRRFSDAETAFSRAAETGPGSSDGFRGLGLARLESKNYQGAYQAWSKAVQLDAKDEKSRYYLGRLFYEADLPEQGAVWLRQALTLDPNDFEVLTYLGLSAEALSFDDTALQLYRKAVWQSNAQGKPYAKAYLSLGNYLTKHGDDAGALAALEEGSQKCPEAHELAALGAILAARHQNGRAEEVLRRAIGMDPTLSQPHYRLGLLLASTGRVEESRKEMNLFQEAKKAEDTSPKITALQK